MCDHLNEVQQHPLEMRVKVLERLLDEAVAVLTAKLRPDEWCALITWMDEVAEIRNGE